MDIEYNAINTIIHYFCKDARKPTNFSLWVNYSNEVVKAPEKYEYLVGKSIHEVADTYCKKGFEHHVIK